MAAERLPGPEAQVRDAGRRRLAAGPAERHGAGAAGPGHEGEAAEAGRGGLRPAFYALGRGSWRDYVTLLHPPYTAWHLSYVAIGAALAPELALSTLGAVLGAFALAVGVGAHALDELNGHPLRTTIPDRVLGALAVVSVSAAAAIGVAGAVFRDPWIGAFVAAGVFLVCAYNLELAAGRFHSDTWFALGWGGFPLLTGYFAATGRITVEAVLAAAFAVAVSLAQRRLSTRVRMVRRKALAVEGRIELGGSGTEPITRETLIAADESALRALALAMCALAAALVIMRLA